MTTTLTRGEIYLQAANLIRTRGLHTGGSRYEGPDGSLCTAGAIRTVIFGKAAVASGFDTANGDVYVDLMVDLGQFLHTTGNATYRDCACSVTAWSDHSTADQVIDVLHKAAAAVRVGPCHHTPREG